MSEMKEKCFYDPEKEGSHQCPKCKRWYCEECYEMFLPVDPMFKPVKTAMMCPQCHSDTFFSPKFERA